MQFTTALPTCVPRWGFAVVAQERTCFPSINACTQWLNELWAPQRQLPLAQFRLCVLERAMHGIRAHLAPISMIAVYFGTLTGAAKPNLLYITVDDMRPQLPGSFGHDDVHAPAVASLAARGTTFARAYCQEAVCSPSR